ncbi:MAG: anti-sigma factor family protein [Mycobacterium leprae]
MHLQPEQLQAYLADALDLSERAALEEHLTQCSHCSEQMAALVADDAFLTESLALDMPEMAWAESQDLTAGVLEQLSPGVSAAPAWVIVGLVVLPGVWLFGLLQESALGWLAGHENIGGLIDIGHYTFPSLYRFLVWLTNGGLLIQFWPLFILGAGYWLWRLSHTKETDVYA